MTDLQRLVLKRLRCELLWSRLDCWQVRKMTPGRMEIALTALVRLGHARETTLPRPEEGKRYRQLVRAYVLMGRCLWCQGPTEINRSNNSTHGEFRRYCSIRCTHNHGQARRRSYKTEYQASYRRKTLGRTCRYCPTTDADPEVWSGCADVCHRCYQQRYRSPCPLCGGPFYRLGTETQPRGCAHCDNLTEYDRMVLEHKRSSRSRAQTKDA